MNRILLATDSGWMNNRVFELDLQLLVDALILAAAVLVLFAALSYLLFNPARAMLKKRQEFITNQIEEAAKEKQEGESFKSEYQSKLKNINQEAESILSLSRKKALVKENEIVEDAKEEASRIMERANKEVELEKVKVKDEVKQQMISVAALMAGKLVSGSMNEAKQEKLIEDTLKEMGDDTWQS